MDANHDGQVSRSEHTQSMLEYAFKTLDAKGDGVITLDEWLQKDRSLDAKEKFRMLDENGDGQVSLDEFLKLAPKHSNLDFLFRDLDKNKDEYLSKRELNPGPGLRLFNLHF